MKRVVLWLVCGLLWSGTAAAQTCLGSIGFDSMPMRAGAAASFSSNTQTITAGVGRGAPAWFGGAGLVLSGVSDVDGMAKGFYGNAGIERSLGAARKYFVCPLVSVFQTFGLHPSPTLSLSALILSFGGSVGFEAATSGTMRIVPFGGFTIDRLRSTFKEEGDPNFSFSDTFASINAGVGLVLNERMVLRPGVGIPISSDDGTFTFAVGFTTVLGR